MCLYGTPQIRKKLSYLPLSLKKYSGGNSGAECGSLKSKVVGSIPTSRTTNAMCVTEIGSSDHKSEGSR